MYNIKKLGENKMKCKLCKNKFDCEFKGGYSDFKDKELSRWLLWLLQWMVMP